VKLSTDWVRYTTWLLAVSLILGACAPALPQSATQDPLSGWTLADLHWLAESPDGASGAQPVAFYFRSRGGELEFRLDLLELTDPLGFDLLIALDTRPGGTQGLPVQGSAALEWDLLLVFPAAASPYALLPNQKPDPGVLPRILRDPALGSLVVTVNSTTLPGDLNHLRAQAFLSDGQKVTAAAGPSGTADQVTRPALLLLEFWDSLPAASPAQALRRWDGAHTGPSGQRHGLAVLLRAAQRWQVPLTLLDLKIPASLQALDLLGGTPLVQDLERQGLLSLPQVAYGDSASAGVSLAYSQAASAAHGFQVSPLAFGPFTLSSTISGNTYFADQIDRSHVSGWGRSRIVPLPYSIFKPPAELPPALNVSPRGLAPEVKMALLRAALGGDTGNLVVLGGDLATSPWADFATAGPVMQYLASTPWIQVLDQTSLNLLPASALGFPSDWPGCRDLLCSPDINAIYPYRLDGTSYYRLADAEGKIYSSLQSLPASALKDLAWNAYFALSRPQADPNLATLQGNYLGQVGYLVAAAQWAANPTERSDCQVDLDLDSSPECVLSTRQIFAILQPATGCLALLAENTSGPARPWIMPSGLTAVGLSDPSTWQLEKGPLADPDALPGAFCNPPGSPPASLAARAPGSIRLLRPDGSRLEFTALGATLTVQINPPADQNLSLPLYMGWPSASPAQPLPPLVSTGAGGSLAIQAPQGGFSLRISPPPVSIQSASSFDTLGILNQPEIPDRSNPPGHYLPLPLATISVAVSGSSLLTFQFGP
jgi:hypothetical protein